MKRGPDWLRPLAGVAFATGLLVPGCRRPPASQPAAPPDAAANVVADAAPIEVAEVEPAAESRPAVRLAPDRGDWSQAQALAKLDDEALGLSAALRLIELGGLHPLVAPPAPDPDILQRLRLMRLDDNWRALGLRTRQANVLASPVLISHEGDVQAAAEGVEEELARLVISPEPVRFPHVVVTPERVLLVNEEVSPAIVADRIAPAWFEVAELEGRPVVVARLPGVELDRLPHYRWDVVEEMFLGPMRDRLPDGQGWIELNGDQSAGLVPICGELPEPPPVPDWQNAPPPQPNRQPL